MMLDLSTALSLIAVLFIGLGGWMVGRVVLGRSRDRPARPTGWLPGFMVMLIGVVQLVVAAHYATFAGSAGVVVFWVAVGLIAEFPVILLLVWSWKDAVRWGVKRDSSNPPIPFLLAGFLVPVVAAAVVLASRFFQIG